MKTCIIVPCYNEAERLPVTAFQEYLRDNPGIHICFVDDGSQDNTKAVLQQLEAAMPTQVTALILPQNQGKAGAVRAGMLHKAPELYDCLGYLDADLATPLDAIQDLEAVLAAQPGLDLVMGSRIKFLGTDIQRDTFRHYTGRVIATFISNILRLPVYDSQCGAKLFRRRVVTALFQEAFLSPWLFDVELLARLIQMHGRQHLLRGHVAEMPLRQWIEQHDSRVKMSYFFRLWYEMYRIHQKYRT
ncbi:glycosyltransferase [Arsenicibacter rosenii]|uniref:Family 2 glycosyl transferase n=1 Tax=Arsenicibacter rosenii TaxID=1750698 RepID=A0A1S2VJB0_9BACT|nr:glycosyltransferase [Arsenicibacter rosenii]OIN58844.1 family 2 glycosyl transferase [Arsenicibacter rosenii]